MTLSGQICGVTSAIGTSRPTLFKFAPNVQFHSDNTPLVKYEGNTTTCLPCLFNVLILQAFDFMAIITYLFVQQ